MTAGTAYNTDNSACSERMVFAALFVINFCISFGFGMADSFFSVYYHGLGAGSFLIGLSVVSYQSAKIFIGPVTGKAEAVHGGGKLMFFSLTVYLFVAVFLLISKNIYYLILLKFIQGAACAAFKPSIYSILNSTLPKDKRGEFFGAFDVSFYAALAIGPTAGGLLINHFGYTGLFSVLLSLCSVVMFIGFIFLRTENVRQVTYEVNHPAFRPGRTEAGLYVFIIGKSALIACFTIYFPIYLVNGSNFSITEAGLMLSLSMAAMALFLKPMGRLSDRWSKPAMVAVGGLLSSLVYLLMPETFSTSSAVLFAVFCGVSGAVSQPAGVAMLMQCSEKGIAASAIMGRFNSVMSVGFILGSVMSSLFAGWLSVRAAFLYVGWLNLAMVLISVMILLRVDSENSYSIVEDAR